MYNSSRIMWINTLQQPMITVIITGKDGGLGPLNFAKAFNKVNLILLHHKWHLEQQSTSTNGLRASLATGSRGLHWCTIGSATGFSVGAITLPGIHQWPSRPAYLTDPTVHWWHCHLQVNNIWHWPWPATTWHPVTWNSGSRAGTLSSAQGSAPPSQ